MLTFTFKCFPAAGRRRIFKYHFNTTLVPLFFFLLHDIWCVCFSPNNLHIQTIFLCGRCLSACAKGLFRITRAHKCLRKGRNGPQWLSLRAKHSKRNNKKKKKCARIEIYLHKKNTNIKMLSILCCKHKRCESNPLISACTYNVKIYIHI